MTAEEVFAANLLEVRHRRQLTQEQLAATAGIHRTEVSLLERGQREPRIGTVLSLARALNVPVGQLLRGIDDAVSP